MGHLSNRIVVLSNWRGSFNQLFDSPLSEFTEENLNSLQLVNASYDKTCKWGVDHPEWGCFGPDPEENFLKCGHIDDHFPKRHNLISGCCNNKIPLLFQNPNYGHV